MIRMFVRHSVGNFRIWRKAHDGFDAERRKMGVVGHGVYQAAGNPKDVTVYRDFKTRQRAERFAASPRLKEVMKGAGVTGGPRSWFVKERKKAAARPKSRGNAAPVKATRAKSARTARRTATTRARAARK